jgi:hypothetical protein
MTNEEQQARDSLLAKARLLGFHMFQWHDGSVIIRAPAGFKFASHEATVLGTWLEVDRGATNPGHYDKLLAEFDLGLQDFYEDQT